MQWPSEITLAKMQDGSYVSANLDEHHGMGRLGC